ncbi:MAG TPA: DPP IV N-terminal domain-containing protein, partial [Sphingomonadales bacterium]|nr:DPP IV N-terminal domain-containing protein [Sphingomonadales bacterium]
PAGDVLVEHWTESANLFSYILETGEGTPLSFNSTRFDWDGRPSPDGSKTAFISDRSGAAELWLHDAENGTLSRLTDFGGAWTQSPRFSPDGQMLAFASPAGGRFNLYLVSVEGGVVTQLTENAGDNFAPVFSPDGKFLYFGSDRGGQWQIWRHDLGSGAETQVTAAGGRAARVSPDGHFLYYTRIDQAGIWRKPLGAPDGGLELVTDALTPVDWNNWEVLDDAIIYVRRPIPEEPELVRLDLKNGESRVLLKVPGLLHNSGLWVDAAGETAWLTLNGPSEADLLLLPGAK